MHKQNRLKFYGLASLLYLVIMITTQSSVFAQEVTVKGKIIDATTNEAVPGVNISIKGTGSGTITDLNGEYTITAPSDATLVVSYIGYSTQEIAVNGQSTIDVKLTEDVTTVNEVVVTGYTSQRKKDITGAVGIVETSQLKAIPSGNVTSQLQGRTSGITVVNSGAPGQSSKLRIRGFSSFSNNNPLYVVDGVPTDNVNDLNPNDVESMSVLKDAGAASIYGSRASNGVIVISTKKGQTGGVKVSYDMYAGTQLAGKGPTADLLNSTEYMDLQWLVYKNDGTSETHPLYGPSSGNPTLPSWGANTDWYGEITNNALIMNHDLSLSGGNENSRFFAGFGVFRQDGIIKFTDNKKYTARFNSEYKILNGKVKFGENFSARFGSGHGVQNNLEASPIQMGPYRSQSVVPNIITVPITGTGHNFVPGEYGGTGIASRLGNNSNAFANLERGYDNGSHNISMLGSAFVDVEITKGLNFRSTVGGTYNSYNYNNFTMSTYENAENTSTPSETDGNGFGGNYVWTNALTFDKTFGDHKIALVAGYEANKIGLGRDLTGSRAGYFSQEVDYRNLNNGQKITNTTSNNFTPRTLVSLFGKVDYSFMNKYLVSATVRRDGSLVFAEEKRFGVFPSFSAGWRLSEESFMKGLTWINDLKIRGSWGSMGNQQPVSPLNSYSLYGGDPAQSFYDINGTFTSSAQGFRSTQIGNPDAKWETNTTTDIGFEATLFNSKFGIVFDWYSKQTEDLLYNPELPATAGNAAAPYINIGSMSNKGYDFELSYKNTFGDLGFNASVTVTTVNNEITKIAEGIKYFDSGGSRIGSFNRNEVGHSMAEFYGYKVIGLFQDAADVTGSPKQDGAEPGFFKYQDTNGDGEISPLDRTYIGNPNPKFTYGLNLGVTYKNFDLSAFLYGSQGNDIFNFNKWWVDFWPSFQGQKSHDLLYNSWTPDRTGGSVPKASNKSNFSTNTVSNSYYIEKGAFARLKNLQLGYTIPESSLNKLHIKGLRVYVQGVNLFTITKYSGLDPEIGSTDDNGGNRNTDDRAFGVDAGNYPNVKQIIFGLNLTL